MEITLEKGCRFGTSKKLRVLFGSVIFVKNVIKKWNFGRSDLSLTDRWIKNHKKTKIKFYFRLTCTISQVTTYEKFCQYQSLILLICQQGV